MNPKMAHTIQVFLCDECSAVHIGMFRNGKLIAEAIPFDPKAFARDLNAAISESDAMQADASSGSKH